MKYWVEVDGRKVEVDLGAGTASLDGRSYTARLGRVGTTPLFVLVLDGCVHEVVALRGEARGTWRLVVGGTRLEVGVVDEHTHAIRDLLGAGAAPPSGGAVRAPMPGLVVRVLVEEGQRVAAGAGVAVVEAMKMQNELTAAVGGVVARVHAVPGRAVEKGQVLVEIESEAPGTGVSAAPGS